jgi:hypothetical protein
MNVHAVNDVRQPDIHTAEPFVSETRCFEIEIAAKLKKYISSGIDQIPTELIQAGCKTFLLLFGTRKNFQKSRRNLLFYLIIGL